jgi:hypothetical protein
LKTHSTSLDRRAGRDKKRSMKFKSLWIRWQTWRKWTISGSAKLIKEFQMAVKIINRAYNEIFTNQPIVVGKCWWLSWHWRLNVRGLFRHNKNHCKLIIWTGRSFCQTEKLGWLWVWRRYVKYFISTYKTQTGTGISMLWHSYQNHHDRERVWINVEVVQNIDVQTFESIPTNFGTKRSRKSKSLWIKEGLRLKYAIFDQWQFSIKFKSLIDGTVSEFVKPNILNNGQFQSMEAVGLQSWMSIRLVEVKPYGKKSGRTCLSIRHQNPYDFVNIWMKIFRHTKQVDSFIWPVMDLWPTIFQLNFIQWNNPNVKIKTIWNGTFWEIDENFIVKNDFKVDSLHEAAHENAQRHWQL